MERYDEQTELLHCDDGDDKDKDEDKDEDENEDEDNDEDELELVLHLPYLRRKQAQTLKST